MQRKVRIRESAEFKRWIKGLRDAAGRARINIRLRQVSLGNPGDVKSVGGRVSEMRIDVGPGYRVYFTKEREAIIVLLVGGDKDSQAADIRRAIEMAREIHGD